MHILIFAPTPDAVNEMQSALGDAVDRYTVAATWPEALSCLKKDCPDLAVIERAALIQLEPTTLLNLAEPGLWPPLILVDTPDAGAWAWTRRNTLTSARSAASATCSPRPGRIEPHGLSQALNCPQDAARSV